MVEEVFRFLGFRVFVGFTVQGSEGFKDNKLAFRFNL